MLYFIFQVFQALFIVDRLLNINPDVRSTISLMEFNDLKAKFCGIFRPIKAV